jgi:hypothetical protein
METPDRPEGALLPYLVGPFVSEAAYTGWHTGLLMESGRFAILVAADLATLREAFSRIAPSVSFSALECRPVIVAAQFQTGRTDAPMPEERLASPDDWPLAEWFERRGRRGLEPIFWGDAE